MGAQKHGSKGGGGGGYVGSFLHLFDWNAKSRKKLFSSKSASPEQPKQTKRTDGNMPMTRFNTVYKEVVGLYGLDFGYEDKVSILEKFMYAFLNNDCLLSAHSSTTSCRFQISLQ